MKFYRFLSILIISCFLYFGIAYAQNIPFVIPEDQIPPDVNLGAEIVFQPAIESPDVVEVSKNIIFDSSKSSSGQPDSVLFSLWDFGDGVKAEGSEVVHAYSQPGDYTVSLIIRDQDGRESEISKSIFVYKRSIFLITDKSSERKRIETLISRAHTDQFVYIRLIESFDSVSEFLAEDEIIKKLEESLNELSKTKFVLIWTEGSLGLTAISHFKRTMSESKVDFSQKSIVFIYDGNLFSFENIAAGTFKTVRPENIILTRTEAIWPLLESENNPQFLQHLQTGVIDYRVIDQSSILVRPWNIISLLINFMIDNGVPSNSVKLILMIPLIATIIAFVRQIIGINTLGVYAPTIMTLGFMALDIWFSLFILLSLFLVATFVRYILRRFRLLYVPRVGILFTIVSFVFLGIFFFSTYFSLSHIVSLSIFPMLMMATLVEKFMSVQYDQGFRPALFLIVQTILISVLCFYIAENDFVKTFILAHPEIVFFFLLINVLLGRFTGLRLVEYLRFRALFARGEEE